MGLRNINRMLNNGNASVFEIIIAAELISADRNRAYLNFKRHALFLSAFINILAEIINIPWFIMIK